MPSGLAEGTSSTTTSRSGTPSAESVARRYASSSDIWLAAISVEWIEQEISTTAGCVATRRASPAESSVRGSARRRWAAISAARRARFAGSEMVARRYGRPWVVSPTVSSRTRGEAAARRPK